MNEQLYVKRGDDFVPVTLEEAVLAAAPGDPLVMFEAEVIEVGRGIDGTRFRVKFEGTTDRDPDEIEDEDEDGYDASFTVPMTIDEQRACARHLYQRVVMALRVVPGSLRPSLERRGVPTERAPAPEPTPGAPEATSDDADDLRVFAADDDSVHDLLSLAVNFTPGVYGVDALHVEEPAIVREKIRGWSQEEREAACRWASAVHARASDNDDVQIPPKPACVVDLEDALDNVGIVP